MTPSLSALAIRNRRRATIARRAVPLSIGLLLGLAIAGHARPASGTPSSAPVRPRPGKWVAVVTNGFKGDTLFFSVSPDRKRVTDVTLKGHWRCRSNGTQRVDVGSPPGAYALTGDSVAGVQKEPYLRWEMTAKFASERAATGTFRVMYDTDCDTYALKWSARAI